MKPQQYERLIQFFSTPQIPFHPFSPPTHVHATCTPCPIRPRAHPSWRTSIFVRPLRKQNSTHGQSCHPPLHRTRAHTSYPLAPTALTCAAHRPVGVEVRKPNAQASGVDEAMMAQGVLGWRALRVEHPRVRLGEGRSGGAGEAEAMTSVGRASGGRKDVPPSMCQRGGATCDGADYTGKMAGRRLARGHLPESVSAAKR
jgi:hypothetical protein